MRRSLVLGLLIASASLLAACGGGSGGGPLPSTGGGGSKTTLALHGGFVAGAGTLSRSTMAVRSRMDASLSALPLAAMFNVPDPYITGGDPSGTSGAQVIAYLTTSDGTMTGVPDPLPTPSVSQTGPHLVIGSPVPGASPLPSAPPVSLGGYDLSPPTTTGQTTLTLSTVVNGQTLTATVKGDNYPELCLAASDAAGTAGGSYGCPIGLYWDAAGVVHTTSDPTAADVSLQFDSSTGTTTLEFPYGATESTGTLLYDELTVPSSMTTTSYTGAQIYTAAQNGPVTFYLATHSGLNVKWQVNGMDPGSSGAGEPAGDVGMLAGPYLTTAGSTFAF